MNYYNEHDRKAAAWLRELIKEGHIPDGWVDERSITDVRPHEVARFTQQHFFAGIGGWSLALRLAGWPDDKPVRTGSCPCQPFSNQGKRLAEKDPRHLWPVFRDLITFGEPAVTFGEQVAPQAGRDWLAGIRADLEGLGYEVGAADLCAASVGAPQPRQRLYWVANPHLPNKDKRASVGKQPIHIQGSKHSEAIEGMEYPEGNGWEQRRTKPNWWGSSSRLGEDGHRRRIAPGLEPLATRLPGRMDLLRGYGNAIVPQVAAEFIKAFLETQ